eukprot:TRINITY_DN1077_c0_g1_i4.p1 TRINITY_DN1077_c0_g1~~TRINITY_DN1077_c0_g1_i4.p1  ORF type:complete len:819 (-),score=208.03 TRINITY_DN1077_c0_g1_i4:15-2471(-)
MKILQQYKNVPDFLSRAVMPNVGLKSKKRVVDSTSQSQVSLDNVPLKDFVLQRMDFNLTVIDACYKAVVSQTYLNDDVAPVEASYKLLLPKSVTVTKFEVEINGEVIRGVVKEKEEAKDDYDDAIAEGKSAFMMEQTESTKGNLYEISVGNLAPGASAVVIMELLGIVKYKDGEYLIDIPVEIMPSKSVDMNLNCQFNTAGPVLMTEGIRGSDFNFSNQTLTCSGKTPKQSLLLAFTTERAEPSLLIGDEEHMMVNFYPDWGEVDEDMVEPQCDIIFLVDRSGSMRGDRMTYTKKALQILIHAIPPDSKFNVVSFGSRFTKLFNESEEYNDDSLRRASNDVSSMDANYGGTDLLNPLESILNENPDFDYPRSIFIITDGQVNDRPGTIGLVKRFSDSCRVFVLGISSAVDKELVTGLSEAGNGSYDFVIKSQDIEDVTMSLFMKVLEPSYRKISVGLPEGHGQVPSRIAPIRNGERLLAFGMPTTKGASISSAIINATDPYGEDFQIEMNNIKRIEGDIIKKFTAISRINELEKEKKTEEIIKLSIEYQIPSKHTAFVAVDERENETSVEYSMKSTQVQTVTVDHSLSRNSLSSFSKVKKKKKGKKPAAPQKLSRSAAPPPPGSSMSLSAAPPPPPSMSFGAPPPPSMSFGAPPPPSMSFGAPPPPSMSFGAPPPSIIQDLEFDSLSGPPIPEKKSFKGKAKKVSSSSVQSSKISSETSGGSILHIQKADGSWVLEEIAGILKLSVSELNSANPCADVENVWATALALAYMELKMQDTKTRWALVARKGTRFIKKALKASSLSFEDLQTAATNLIPSN